MDRSIYSSRYSRVDTIDIVDTVDTIETVDFQIDRYAVKPYSNKYIEQQGHGRYVEGTLTNW